MHENDVFIRKSVLSAVMLTTASLLSGCVNYYGVLPPVTKVQSKPCKLASAKCDPKSDAELHQHGSSGADGTNGSQSSAGKGVSNNSSSSGSSASSNSNASSSSSSASNSSSSNSGTGDSSSSGASTSSSTNSASTSSNTGTSSEASSQTGAAGRGQATSSDSPSGNIGSGRLSDRRLKTDINRIGTTAAGVPVYTFRYIWGGPFFVGTMAQDLLLTHPEAVIRTASGYYMVDYDKLDLKMTALPKGPETGALSASLKPLFKDNFAIEASSPLP